MSEDNMVERVGNAIDGIDVATFIVRRKIDKSGYEVVHVLALDRPISDDTRIVVYEGNEGNCEKERARRLRDAFARAAIKAMREPRGALLDLLKAHQLYAGQEVLDIWDDLIDAALDE